MVKKPWYSATVLLDAAWSRILYCVHEQHVAFILPSTQVLPSMQQCYPASVGVNMYTLWMPMLHHQHMQVTATVIYLGPNYQALLASVSTIPRRPQQQAQTAHLRQLQLAPSYPGDARQGHSTYYDYSEHWGKWHQRIMSSFIQSVHASLTVHTPKLRSLWSIPNPKFPMHYHPSREKPQAQASCEHS